ICNRAGFRLLQQLNKARGIFRGQHQGRDLCGAAGPLRSALSARPPAAGGIAV
ncbi:MAG: hypothetical protein K2J09_01820, partial [Muribaculaceae bacterium]|nr:hypothetical protein [Muribaculaceae bacterium]